MDIFTEYAVGLQKLTLTIIANSIESYTFSLTLPNLLTINHGIHKKVVSFDEFEFSVNTCNVVSKVPPDTASFELLAKCLVDELESDCLKIISRHLIKGESLLCKFCDTPLLNLKNISNVEELPSVDVMAGSEPNSFFCHSHGGSVPDKPTSPLCRMEDTISVSSALCNGVEIIVNRSAWNKDATLQCKGSDRLFCSRCRLMIGRSVGSDPESVQILWTNCVNLWTEELDIDGEYLRHIEVPLISSDADFFHLLFSHLLDAQCYRVILSAGSIDGLVEYALLWLFDQKIYLNNTSLDSDTLESNGDSEEIYSMPKGCFISRILYKINGSDCEENSGLIEEKRNEWAKDFSVVSLTLPWETCVNLVSCLNQITQRLAPNSRYATGVMQGFTIGGIPLRN